MIADKTAAETAKLRNTVILVHLLFAVSLVIGATVFIGIVMAYKNRKKAAGTIYGTHFDYAINTFWLSGTGGMALIGLIFAAFVCMSSDDAIYSALVLSVVFCSWLLVRTVRPIIAISADQAVFDVLGIF